MRKVIGLVVTICFLGIYDVYAQYRPLYDIGLMNSYLNSVREMSQRAAEIKQTVQPYRERQYQYFKEGKYREAEELCYDVFKQYVYYVHDNKAIWDMELLAGDCALKIGEYESAIFWYKKVQKAEVDGMESRLSQVFDAVMSEARNAYNFSNYNNLWIYVSIAQETGMESGECYYYSGVCYENKYDYKNAKKMYKLAKRKHYTPAILALQELKKRK